MDVLILVGGFTVLCMLGMPVAYALGLAAILTAIWIGMPLEAIMLKTSDGMDDFPLLAIPFFILSGAFMTTGGVAKRMIRFAVACIDVGRAVRRPRSRRHSKRHVGSVHQRDGAQRPRAAAAACRQRVVVPGGQDQAGVALSDDIFPPNAPDSPHTAARQGPRGQMTYLLESRDGVL